MIMMAMDPAATFRAQAVDCLSPVRVSIASIMLFAIKRDLIV